MANIVMLGTGFIGRFYTVALHAQRSRDRVVMAYARNADNAKKFAAEWNIPRFTTDMAEAVNDPEADAVVIALPNHMHLEAVRVAAQAGKAVLCTKPLGRNAAESREMLEIVEKAGVFHGYLEDLVYTPKFLRAAEYVHDGALGRILWVRSREAHPGPHSDWFWSLQYAGGGAILDLGCHCIEIARTFIGKKVKPVEVMCWAATQVKPIDAEDHAIALVKYANGAIGQFEVSWCFRGGLDLRDEVAGTEGSIQLDHFTGTGLDVFTAVGRQGYVAEKAESDTGWLFPMGDEVAELGYTDMFTNMFNSMEQGVAPTETFYDGYVVNAVMDACYRSVKSKKWEAVELDIWRGDSEQTETVTAKEYDAQYYLVKDELLPSGARKLILKDKKSGEIIQRVTEPTGSTAVK